MMETAGSPVALPSLENITQRGLATTDHYFCILVIAAWGAQDKSQLGITAAYFCFWFLLETILRLVFNTIG